MYEKKKSYVLFVSQDLFQLHIEHERKQMVIQPRKVICRSVYSSYTHEKCKW